MDLGEVSADCRQRLVRHYGASADSWIARAPALLQTAARRWGLTLLTYHDVGHASVIATATSKQGRPLILKAWTDSTRYRHEVSALRHWSTGPAAEVIDVADDLAVAALEMVGQCPGGTDRPACEFEQVAEALNVLHGLSDTGALADLPRLADHLREELTPRVWSRLRVQDLGRWDPVARVGLRALGDALGEPLSRDGRQTLLHGDLYRENVLFSNAQGPIFVDPLPMVGSAAFDWAFWVVYYEVERGFQDRMTLAVRTSNLSEREIRRWCAALLLDGLLYYLETEDPRTTLFGDTAVRFALDCERSTR
ncbi:aminoglycoside phosphotransferase family protein [Kribbella sp. NPDC056951]|uniref:aminoglycoside phosphotransferase family protein n=1 Tax=Kribbella sp. NPDC056951 TaxID=3345978 RepID=UPI003627EFDB